MAARPRPRGGPADLEERLAHRWEGRDPLDLANAATLRLPDSASDWSPPPGVEPKRPPVRLGVGIPDPPTLPRDDLRAAMERALAAPRDGPLRYHFGPGYEPLRELLAERFSRQHGLEVGLDWFRLTNGSAGAIDLICRALIEPGDVIVCESPSYMGTLHNFRGVLADIRPVPVDEEGIRTDELERLLARLETEGKRAKIVYTISAFQNPTAATLSERRRQELLRVAADRDLLVLDDVAYGELWFEEPPPSALSTLSRGHGVITVGTFSKILATGLRVGWICARPEWIELFGRMRFDMGQSVLVHRMLVEYMRDGCLEEHVDRMRALYAGKSDLLCRSLREFAGPSLDFEPPAGGFYLWIRLLGGLKAEDLWRAGAEEGVWFPTGRSFFPDRHDPTGEHIRLAFPWTSREDLREGARRIGLACSRLAGDA
jgi:2-aminoadipate transaminase